MRRIIAIVPLVLLAHCVRPSEPPPPPAPAPSPAPAPAPVPAPEPAPNWADRPATPGDWVYRADPRGGVAFYGPENAGAQFTMRCDRAAGQVTLERAGTGSGRAMTIRTTSTTRALPVSAGSATGAGPSQVATLPARDPLLDAIGFSRGRFAVEVAGLPDLILPTWAEVQRVVEDCRR